jgi:hypothetical protein
MDVDRRRSERVSFSQEEAAIVHAGGRDILVRVIDFSATGALLSLLDSTASSESSANCGESVSLAVHLNQSVFHVGARVVRRTPGFLAVEFFETLSSTFGERN